MEHAPLRPVPARPAGPIDAATALRQVEAWLPALAPETAQALALVVLAERPRAEVAAMLGVPEPELCTLLAAARKELRQTIVGLGGSGWCERAEGLISDRLDGPLAGRDARRLDVHLRNCTRCVEHERRLVQATDALIAGAGGFARTPVPAADPPPLVEATPRGDVAEEIHAEEVSPPAAQEAPPGDDIAAVAEALVVKRTRRQVAAAVAWNSLIAIAVILTIATVALTIAAIVGAQL
jgi:Putative zinc-finger